MRRQLWGTCALIVCMLLCLEVPGRSAAWAAPSARSKKACHTVTKKVHGKKKKVKVCSAKAKPTPVPTATLTPSALSESLAAAIASAPDDAARALAIQHAFEAADIGIYDDATGAPVKTGMEVNAGDLYLLTGETNLLAQGYASHDMYSPADLAVGFAATGVLKGREADAAAAMSALVQGTVKWATDNPAEHAALVPLIVRALGQHDTAVSDPLTDPSKLDAVQFQLLAVYFLGPVVHAAGQTAKSGAFRPHDSALAGLCTGLRVALNPFNPNTYLYLSDPNSPQLHVLLDDVGALYGGKVGEAVAQALGTAIEDFGKSADLFNNAGIVAKLIHMLYLNRAISIDTTPTQPAAHYGPKGGGDPDPNAGLQMRIKATVTMNHVPPKTLQTCLQQAGFTIPDQGPVPNFRVVWRNVTNDLTDYGTVDYEPADGNTGDGTHGTEKGVSTLVFTPKNEELPGFGTLVKAVGEVQPWGAYGIGYGNEPAAIEELIGAVLGHLGSQPSLVGPNSAWTVGYHVPRGFTFTVSYTVNRTLSPSTGGVGSGGPGGHPPATSGQDTYTELFHLCGSDPYGRTGWNRTETARHVLTYGDGYVDDQTQGPYTYEGSMVLADDNGFEDLVNPGAASGEFTLGDAHGTMEFVPGPVPTVHINLTAFPPPGSNETDSPTTWNLTAPVTEDTGCPLH